MVAELNWPFPRLSPVSSSRQIGPGDPPDAALNVAVFFVVRTVCAMSTPLASTVHLSAEPALISTLPAVVVPVPLLSASLPPVEVVPVSFCA